MSNEASFRSLHRSAKEWDDDPAYAVVSHANEVSELRLSDLRSLALAGLTKMYLGDGAFVHTLRGVPTPTGRTLRPEGNNLRYAAIVALGLSCVSREQQVLVLNGQSAAELAKLAAARAAGGQDLGEIALAAWAAAEVAGVYDESLFTVLADRIATDSAVETVACSWALCAALAGADLGGSQALIRFASDRLLGALGNFGIFPHLLPAKSGRWGRAHIGCFADQVYPIQALARLAAAQSHGRALEAANVCAAQICKLQGAAGQWWWHYDVRDGNTVEGYPVYSVHQHAMAPMALLDLKDAGGADHWPAIVRGLAWLQDRPEVRAPLIAESDCVIWRKVGRREPPKATRKISAVTSSFKRGWRLPGLDAAFPPRRIDYECRPYEFGWLLYAWRQDRPVPFPPYGGVSEDG